MKHLICLAAISLFLTTQNSPAEEDPRFASGNLGVQNSLLQGIYEVALKAFDRESGALRGVNVRKVAGTYVVSGFVTLDEVKEPVTEKDFERISKFFEPFIEAQVDIYKKRDIHISSVQNDFPLPDNAKGYTKKEVPKMAYIVSGEKEDLFCMEISFSERKEDHLVINFTIVVMP